MPIGTVWGVGTWADDAWGADTWGNAAPSPPAPPRSGGGSSTGVRRDNDPRVPAAVDVGDSSPVVWRSLGR